jgi:hypothetical protein
MSPQQLQHWQRVEEATLGLAVLPVGTIAYVMHLVAY